MKTTLLSLLLLFIGGFLFEGVVGAEWAVLVAGSRGWWNYRHHADVCHAYHTLRTRGIPAENIITMLYDDVAHATQNPFPGKMFNRPGNSSNLVDVNEGCIKDYIGETVTPENFLNIIQGKAEEMQGIGSGRVLKSNASDDVFINFVDHGAPGLVAFPSGELYAKDLLNALQYMHAEKMYGNLVFYLEACESGSMFPDLPSGIQIFAETAANAKESSWATYCPPNDDYVDGQTLNTCLGDEFSVNWMEDTDLQQAGQKETLLQQFTRVKNKTKKSHVLNFGDIKKMQSDDISDFLGEHPDGKGSDLSRIIRENPLHIKESSLVDSRDVALVSKFYAHLRSPSPETQLELNQELTHRQQTDKLFSRIVRMLLHDEEDIEQALSTVPPSNPKEWDCHKSVNEAFKAACGQWTDYSLKYSSTLLSLCENLKHKMDMRHTEYIISTMYSICVPVKTSLE